MNAKTVKINSILTSAMLLLYAGCGVLNVLLSLLFGGGSISLPTGVFLCLALMLPTVVLLAFGIRQAKRKQGVFDLIFSILTLLVSIVWMIAAVLNWATALAQNLIIELSYRLNVAMSLGDLLALLYYLNVAYMVFTTVVALYLLAVYAISILRAKQKWLQVKAELHKPAVAVMILIPNLISFVRLILNRIMLSNVESGIIDLNAYSTYISIFSFGTLVVETLLILAMIALVLIFGLIVKKQPTPKAEAQDEPLMPDMTGWEPPAGVNADDI